MRQPAAIQVRPLTLSALVNVAYRSFNLWYYTQQLKVVRQFQRVNDTIGTVSSRLLFQDAVNRISSASACFDLVIDDLRDSELVSSKLCPYRPVVRFNSCVSCV